MVSVPGSVGFASLVSQSEEERGKGEEWDLRTFIVTFSSSLSIQCGFALQLDNLK